MQFLNKQNFNNTQNNKGRLYDDNKIESSRHDWIGNVIHSKLVMLTNDIYTHKPKSVLENTCREAKQW